MKDPYKWVKENRIPAPKTMDADYSGYNPPEFEAPADFPKEQLPGFDLPEHIRPINPYERTGLKGRGTLYRFGPNMAADAIVISNKGKALLIKRKDTGLWSTPGGFVESGDTPLETSIKECGEETGMQLSENDLTNLYQREVPKPEYVFEDWRNTDNAWIMTCVYYYEVNHESTDFNPDHEVEDVDWFDLAAIGKLNRSEYHTDRVIRFMNLLGKVT